MGFTQISTPLVLFLCNNIANRFQITVSDDHGYHIYIGSGNSIGLLFMTLSGGVGAFGCNRIFAEYNSIIIRDALLMGMYPSPYINLIRGNQELSHREHYVGINDHPLGHEPPR